MPVLALVLGGALLIAADDGTAKPGLLLKLSNHAATDVRVARLLALHVPQGTPPSDFLEAGPFDATWDGFLEVEARDRFTFEFEGEGNFDLDLDGKPVLRVLDGKPDTRTSKPVRLNKGSNRLAARFASTTGSATVRILWSSSEFPREPLPPPLLSHEGDAGDAARRTRGRELFATLRCVKCHTTAVDVTRAMPELQMDAPSLRDAGARLEREWVSAWLRDPRAMRADARMPGLGLDAAQASDIAAFLALQGKPDGARACSDAEVKSGEARFTSLGCASCHVTPADAGVDPALVSLGQVARKWRPTALEQFLLQPTRHYQWIRMPDFHLTTGEARELAGYLLAITAGSMVEKADVGDAARGRELVMRSGCVSCHTLDVENQSRSPALASLRDWSRGCLAEDVAARGVAPDFALDQDSRAALRMFCQSGFDPLQRHAPADFAERTIRELRCLNCHSRDRHQAPWRGSEPTASTPPNLTWVGEKLQLSFIERTLAGTLDFKPRPWLNARMPSFPARARELARGLSLMHGCLPEAAREPPANAAVAAIGKKLTGNQGGFSCTSCHAVGGQSALQVFEAEGLNLMYVAERLRRDFFLRWIMNPMRVEPSSRMPTYADDQGKTAFVEIFHGDARQQFAAIWEFLQGGRAISIR